MDENAADEKEQLNHESTPVKKCELSFFQKLLIMGVILFIWVTIVIVELIYTFSQEEDKAEINCIYYISKAGENTTLLGSDFIFSSISQIVIDDDDEITEPIKVYKFKKV